MPRLRKANKKSKVKRTTSRKPSGATRKTKRKSAGVKPLKTMLDNVKAPIDY